MPPTHPIPSNSSTIFTWLSKTDINVAITERAPHLLEPNDQVKQGQFSVFMEQAGQRYQRVYALAAQSPPEREQFEAWCRAKGWRHVSCIPAPGVKAHDYRAIYDFAKNLLDKQTIKEPHYLISGGSKAMGLVWILLNSQTAYRGTLWNVVQDTHLVEKLDFPFEIDATYLDQRLAVDWTQLEAVKKVIVRSHEVQECYRTAILGAQLHLPVMIFGESGTGKEHMAKACAEAAGFTETLVVNCGAIPKDLVESELFGYKKGAFTGANFDKKGFFELANKKALFLDEIGELPLEAQVKLLRVLQEGTFRRVGDEREMKVQFYLIAATHRNLATLVEEGKFREDLFYRLMVWPITLPPLRHRSERDRSDLITSLWHENQKAIWRHTRDKNEKELPDQALKILMNHTWPGNIRQLDNTLKRLYGLAYKAEVTVDLVQQVLEFPVPFNKNNEPQSIEHHMDRLLIEKVEEAYLTTGSKAKAAQKLGKDVTTLFRNYDKACEAENHVPKIPKK